MYSKKNLENRTDGLPGSHLVVKGIIDLQNSIKSEESLLVLIASPRLRALGFDVPELSIQRPVEHQLYQMIEINKKEGSHSYYNSLIGLIVSFARAYSSERYRK